MRSRNQITYIAALFCTALSSTIAFANDLPSVLREAVLADPRVLSARSNLQAKQVDSEGATSVYFPTLRATGSVGSSKSDDPLSQDGSKRVYGLELEQPIPLFGHESSRVKLAEEELSVETTEAERITQEVLAELLQVVFEYQASEALLVVRKEMAENLREQVMLAHKTVAGGGMKTTELSQVQSRAIQADAELAEAKAELAVAEVKLKQRMGGDADLNLSINQLRTWWPLPNTRQEALDMALGRAVSLRKALAEASVAVAECEVARSDLWPKLSLSLQWQKGTVGDATVDSSGVFANLNAPLFDGGTASTRIKSTSYRAAAARETADYERQYLIQRFNEAWTRWLAADAMVIAWKKAEAEETALVELVQQQLDLGGASRHGYLQAVHSRLEAKSKRIEYARDRDAAEIRLLAESGVLSLQAIQGD